MSREFEIADVGVLHKFSRWITENFEVFSSDMKPVCNPAEEYAIQMTDMHGDVVWFEPIPINAIYEFYYLLSPEEKIEFENIMKEGTTKFADGSKTKTE